MAERLYRSRKKRVIGGVAGGLGDYLNIDPVIIRIFMVIMLLLKGIGILVYIIMWIVIPEEPVESNIETSGSSSESPETESTTGAEINPEYQKSSRGRTVFGTILILIGLLFLSERFIPTIHFMDLFPIIFILFGAGLIWNSFRKQNGGKI